VRVGIAEQQDQEQYSKAVEEKNKARKAWLEEQDLAKRQLALTSESRHR
jgi:hypothetical protein